MSGELKETQQVLKKNRDNSLAHLAKTWDPGLLKRHISAPEIFRGAGDLSGRQRPGNLSETMAFNHSDESMNPIPCVNPLQLDVRCFLRKNFRRSPQPLAVSLIAAIA